MPAPLISKEEVLNRLTTAFRQGGYQGTTLKQLCEATGLVKASLYHYFPGGKADMAQAVLDHVNGWFGAQIITPLGRNTDPAKRLKSMTTELNRFYQRGNSACLIDLFGIGEAGDLFHKGLADSAKAWEDAIVKTLVDAGQDEEEAVARAESALIQIEGALVMARAKRVPQIFTRTLNSLQETLLAV